MRRLFRSRSTRECSSRWSKDCSSVPLPRPPAARQRDAALLDVVTERRALAGFHNGPPPATAQRQLTQCPLRGVGHPRHAPTHANLLYRAVACGLMADLHRRVSLFEEPRNMPDVGQHGDEYAEIPRLQSCSAMPLEDTKNSKEFRRLIVQLERQQRELNCDRSNASKREPH